MKIPPIIFLAGTLCLASVSLLSAKTYDVSISTTAMVGSVQIPAGEYRLRLDGDQAVFTGVNKETFTTPVKMETVSQKYDETAVVSTSQDGTQHIESIELGGSKTKLDFK